MEEVTETLFVTSKPSISIHQVGVYLIQVYPGGLRHILLDGTFWDWAAPDAHTIVVAATNRQIVVALDSG